MESGKLEVATDIVIVMGSGNMPVSCPRHGLYVVCGFCFCFCTISVCHDCNLCLVSGLTHWCTCCNTNMCTCVYQPLGRHATSLPLYGLELHHQVGRGSIMSEAPVQWAYS